MLSFPSSAHVTLFIHFPSYQHYHIVPSILLDKILISYLYFMVKKASATHRPKSSPPRGGGGATWMSQEGHRRISPLGEWLVNGITSPFISIYTYLYLNSPRWLSITMVINHLLNGMILQVLRKLARNQIQCVFIVSYQPWSWTKNKNWMEVPNFLIFSHQQPGER